MTRPIADLDVPLPLLRAQVVDLVARQRDARRVEESTAKLRWLLAHPTPATPGELAEMRHLLYDADPDATVPAFPYPTPQETS
ncbi:hypothetical protein [Streptomyces sp. NPDC058108]|uniref:hypothetical protein n=1 Tax=Streptomyces sp. NPDC058108 TaxID=3346344 RepID=UPI0036E8EE22